MSASISRYLKDFSAPKIDLTRVPRYFPDLDDAQPQAVAMPATPQLPPQPRIDIDAERRDAFSRGREDALAEADVRHASEIAKINARHAAELDAVHLRNESETGALLHAFFSNMGSELANIIADQTAHVLAPVVQDILMEKAVRDLAQMIRHSIGAGEAVKITVKGPLRMFEALKRHLNDETLAFRHEETADIDLSVEFDDSILVTRMAAWADTVRKVLA